MSKLSWFAEPSNWTVYDRFVARAVSVQDMISFYETLDQRGFLSFAQRIQPAAVTAAPKGGVRFVPLFGPRVGRTGACVVVWILSAKKSCSEYLTIRPRMRPLWPAAARNADAGMQSAVPET